MPNAQAIQTYTPFERYYIHMLPPAASLTNLRLDLHEISIAYGPRQVVHNLNLVLRTGEVLVVAGTNGSGKSSLLRLLCGLQRASHGQISYYVNDVQLTREQIRSVVGWLSPDLQLYRELTALENLRFFTQLRGLKLDDSQLIQRLDLLGLAGRSQDLLATFSSGMIQRMRFAFALLHDPLVLLLDEPTVTFDERGAAMCAEIIAAQRQRGITVVATNDTREEALGDYVLRLG